MIEKYKHLNSFIVAEMFTNKTLEKLVMFYCDGSGSNQCHLLVYLFHSLILATFFSDFELFLVIFEPLYRKQFDEHKFQRLAVWQ